MLAKGGRNSQTRGVSKSTVSTPQASCCNKQPLARFGAAARPALGTPSPQRSIGRRAISPINPNGCLGHRARIFARMGI